MTDRVQLPYCAYEAVLTLYRSGPSGEALTSETPVWAGAVANKVEFGRQARTREIWASGDLHPTQHHLRTDHTLHIDRTWLIRLSDAADVDIEEGGEYVLEIVWESEGYWFKRVYFGVQFQRINEASAGALHFLSGQELTAQYFTRSGGAGDASVGTPLLPAGGAEQPIGFFRETELASGDYLLGHYKWSQEVNLLTAKVIALASQADPTVLTLEVDGVLTAHTLTIPAGAEGAEVTDEITFTAVTLAANSTARWKVTSAPATGRSTLAAVMMPLVPLT